MSPLHRALLTSISFAAIAACSSSSGGTHDSGSSDTGMGGPDASAHDSGLPIDLTCAPGFGTTDACGGDLAGTSWTYRAACTLSGTLDPILQFCPGATISNEARAAAGTLSFTATNFERHAMTTLSGHVAVPSTCAVFAGGCMMVSRSIQTAIANSTADCTGTSGCDCTVSLEIDLNDMGTYATSNGVVTATPNVGFARDYFYCVKDTVLRYKGKTSNPADDQLSYVLERN